MRSEDIRRIQRHEQDPTQTHITLQYLGKPKDFNQYMVKAAEHKSEPMGALIGPHVDILCQGTGTPLPSAIIMDFIYGVAAYHLWSSRRGQGDIHEVMANYHDTHYKILTHPPNQPTPIILQGEKPTYQRRDNWDVQIEAMDELNMAMTLLSP